MADLINVSVADYRGCIEPLVAIDVGGSSCVLNDSQTPCFRKLEIDEKYKHVDMSLLALLI